MVESERESSEREGGDVELPAFRRVALDSRGLPVASRPAKADDREPVKTARRG